MLTTSAPGSQGNYYRKKVRTPTLTGVFVWGKSSVIFLLHFGINLCIDRVIRGHRTFSIFNRLGSRWWTWQFEVGICSELLVGSCWTFFRVSFVLNVGLTYRRFLDVWKSSVSRRLYRGSIGALYGLYRGRKLNVF